MDNPLEELEGYEPPPPRGAAPPDLEGYEPPPPASTEAPAFVTYEPPAPPSPREQRIGNLEALGRGATQGVYFGYADELQGVGSKLAGDDIDRAGHRGVLPRAIEDAAPLSDRTDYDVQRDAYRADDKQAAADTAFDKRGMSETAKLLTPDSMFGVGEGLGTAATAVIPVGGAAGRAASLGARLKAGAKTGALFGALAGHGNAEGGAVDQAISTGAGAATGAALGAAGGELVRGAGKAVGAAREYAGKIMDFARGGSAAREVQFGSPELARTAETFVDPRSTGLRGAATRGGDAQRIEQGSRELGGKVDELLKHSDVIKWDEDIAAKGDHVRHMMAREQPPADGLPKIDAVYDAVKREWDLLAKDVEKGEGREAISRLQREAFDAYENRLKNAADDFDLNNPSEYTAERFMALDDLKRHLQKEIAPGRLPFVDRMRERMETPLRLTLEDSSIVGTGPAALQRLRNAGWSRRLQAKGRPERAFIAEEGFGERGSDPYRVLDTSDAAKVLGIYKNAGTIEGDRGGRALTEWADREAGLLEALTGHEGADAALVERATRARQLATEIQGAMQSRAGDAQAAADLARVNAAPRPAPGAVRAALERSGPIAGVIEALQSPQLGKRAERMGQLEELLSRSPRNKFARRELEALTPGGTSRRLGETGGRGTERAGSHAAGSTTSGATSQAIRATRAAYARQSDDATQDQEWGGLLTSKPAGERRDAAYSMLIQTDSAFRARERERAHKRNEAEQGD